MKNGGHPGNVSSNFSINLLSRRQVLQLAGVSAAGIVGLDILAACGGGPGPTSQTPVVVITETANVQLGESRQLPSYFLGYNAVPIQGASWRNSRLLSATQLLQPGALRYPGGTIANYWDWKTGWFLPAAPSGMRNLTPLYYGLPELQTAVQATGAIPIYVLNMHTSTLAYQLEMLRTAKGMGLPVELVELGNELYLLGSNGSDYSDQFPTGGEYGKLCNSWITAIKAEFPNAKIGFVGESPLPGKTIDVRRRNWNQDVLQTVRGADAITLHPYITFSFVQTEKKKAHPDAESAEMSTLSAQGGKSKVLSTFFSRWQVIETLIQSLPQNMEVWHTEYNLEDAIGRLHASWLSGVFVTAMTLTLLEETRTTQACYYELTGTSGKEAIFQNENGFKALSNPPERTTPYAFSAVGLSLRLLGDAIKGMTSAQKLTFTPNPSITDGDIPFPALKGWIFSDGSHQRAMISNSSPIGFSLPADMVPGTTQYQQLATDPLKMITGPDTLAPQSGTIQGRLTLPPYSVTEIK